MPSISQSYQQLITALQGIYDAREAENITRILFEDAFGIHDGQSAALFTHSDRLADLTERLLQEEPLQYVTGSADFFGYQFKVDQRVLIPRPETEELVYYTLEKIREKWGKAGAIKVLDIGTGSGCIPITVKKEYPTAELWAIDVSQEALDVAHENAQSLEVPIHFEELNILEESYWAELPDFDVVLSNPPYIPLREAAIMRDNVKAFEPGLALFVSDEDPLLFYRTIARFCTEKLRPGGIVLVETNAFNAVEVQEEFRKHQLADVTIIQDMSGKDRIVSAQRTQ